MRMALSIGMAFHCETAPFVMPISLATAVGPPKDLMMSFVSISTGYSPAKHYVKRHHADSPYRSAKLLAMELHERIKLAIKQSGLTQNALAEKLGISRGSVSQWVSGNIATRTVPSRENLFRLAELSGVPIEWLWSGRESAAHEPQKSASNPNVSEFHDEEKLDDGEVEIPALNLQVGAGSRIVCDQIQEERKFRYARSWLQKYGLDSKYLFRVRVYGDSMEPYIKNGAWVTVDKSRTNIQNGKIYVLRSGEEIQIKALFKRPDSGIIIRSNNPAYPDVQVSATDMEHIAIIGEVIEFSVTLISPIKNGSII